jgi:hypothetical protein
MAHFPGRAFKEFRSNGKQDFKSDNGYNPPEIGNCVCLDDLCFRIFEIKTEKQLELAIQAYDEGWNQATEKEIRG